jgi:hypothetical protein
MNGPFFYFGAGKKLSLKLTAVTKVTRLQKFCKLFYRYGSSKKCVYALEKYL